MNTQTASNDTTVLHLDIVLAAMLATLPGLVGWALRGWADRLRAASHPMHIANSWAKHAGEFGEWQPHALALTLTHLIDRGLSLKAAEALLDERTAARARKAA